ncbi:MAG: DNA protecting protein DprA [Omnitrophica WOR_2 bacterium RIFCSPHIGHO2_02_FULL_45_21]|nr:MAG: DNA protecting protein DprA [Omnitrophica WOR_2 bacterium RIFCSPHIGHO2_02_FULL_45_21]
MTEQEAVIALNMISGIGSQRLKKLWEAFGAAPKVFLASEDKLKKIEGIGDKIAQEITAFRFENLKKELDLVKKLKVRIITLEDKEYPQNLKNIYDPPICLYLKGKLKEEDVLSLAIVGSRRASFYGASCAEKFAYELAGLGVTIISGLARGIDTQAHKGALKATGRTIAVLGSGLSCIYPPENKGLSEEIAERGALLSEFPLNTKPLAQNFPRRNRVISGLSQAVLVVEAARNSGALITADFALEQGRDVFAIPGKVDSATSLGTNRLIKQGAKLVDNVEDILEELKPKLEEFTKVQILAHSLERIADRKAGLHAKRSSVSAQKVAPIYDKQYVPICENELSDDERLVYNFLNDKPRYADELIEELKLPSAKVLSILSKLEMRKIVIQRPGKLFSKAGNP